MRINEVNTHDSDNGDWVELYNTGTSPVNLTGAILSDDDDNDAYVIGSDPGDKTTIAGGGSAV